MNSTIKTTICVGIALIFAFIILFSFVNSFADKFDYNNISEKKFYQQLDVQEKKIFLLGSSQVGRLNVTYINNYLSENGHNDYTVYNIGKSNNFPKDRVKIVDDMIKAKPNFVFYGIGFRDFGYNIQLKSAISSTVTSQEACENYHKNVLPNPKQYFQQLILENFDYRMLEDPKDVTLNIFHGDKIEQSYIKYENRFSPFYSPNNDTNKIMTEEKIIDTIHQYCHYKDLEEEITEKAAIKQIINKLEKNHIRVILFITPHDKFSLENIPDYEKESFNSNIKEIASKFNVDVYSFENNYSDMQIWQWPNEVSTNYNSIIYSKDMSEIILKEIES